MIGCILNAAGQIFLKKGMTILGPLDLNSSHLLKVCISIFTNIYILGGIVAYGLSLIISLIALSRLPVTYFYPISVSISYIFVTIAGTYFLGDALSSLKIVGLSVIMFGVYLVAVA